jgi:hypothetical protein
MYPNMFLQSFWRMSLRPEVFVAMSFAEPYEKRFEEVIRPAIESISWENQKLKPVRVDFSKSGDSILTEMTDRIAHCQIFLADVSTVGYDSKTATPYRNANVLYEVGLAVACRQSTEVLLIRDDKHPFLFDVSAIPHKYINFTDPKKAKKELRVELQARLKERERLSDARVDLSIATLSSEEMSMLNELLAFGPHANFGFPEPRYGHLSHSRGSPIPNEVTLRDVLLMSAMPRLLDKQIIKVVGKNQYGEPMYAWTQLGYVVAQKTRQHLRQIPIGRSVAAWHQG